MMEILMPHFVEILSTLLTALVGLITGAVMSYLKKKGIVAKLQANKEVANIAVHAIEQTYTALHGEEKLNLAKIEFVKLAKSKGVKISEKDLDTLIESAVKEMNKTIKESK